MMHGHPIIRIFWAGLAASMLVAALLIRVSLMPSWSTRIPIPSLPIPGQAYVSAYRDGEIDHHLFLFGLFGFGDRIRNADVLILGSSHPQLALSAARIASSLSQLENRTFAVFNMGMGYGEGSAFAREVLQANKVTGSTVVIDLFSPHGTRVSPFGQTVLQLSTAQAYQRVAQMWAVFLRDWLTDGLLVRVRFTVAGGISVERAMYRVLIRDWNNGDVVDIWTPEMGSRFQNPSRGSVHSLFDAPTRPGDISIPRATVDFFAERQMTPYAVLLPYPDGNTSVAAAWAANGGISFVAISPSGLEYYDRDHVTAAGRILATERLLAGLGWRRSRDGK
jgi:hypothetical protein